MAERGGPAAQDGIYYQNTVAARYLVDMLDLAPRPVHERVVEVRVEAPVDVDDVVVHYADGRRDWIQVKTAIQSSGDAWTRLWTNLKNQSLRTDFRSADRLLIVIGEFDDVASSLREICERAKTSVNLEEWRARLTVRQLRLLESIEEILGQTVSAIELLRQTTVEILPLPEIERFIDARRASGGYSQPVGLLPALRDIVSEGARRRRLFHSPSLRQTLLSQYQISISEPSGWGLPAYRAAVERLSWFGVPGTGISGSAEELFVWPRARDYQTTRPSDFEDELFLQIDLPSEGQDIDLREFPSPELDRCVIVAGPGQGKSALLNVIAARLAGTPYVPVFIPLPSFAASDAYVLEYLEGEINRELSVQPNWLQLVEQGLVVLLFDGLDEIPLNRRQLVLGRIASFSARHASVPWLLTVRDPAALSGPADARIIELLPLNEADIVRFAQALSARAVPGLNADEFARQLSHYPDLSRLARIPLFLVMMIALVNPPQEMPEKRADLIDRYLKTLFSPFEHKTSPENSVSVSTLRAVAEALAFERLEQQEVGARDQEVLSITSRVGSASESPEAVLAQLLANGILRRQSSIRLQFPYPIVQEYLAACYLINKQQDSLADRLGDAVQRPWAQVMQFAIEIHPNPEHLVRQLLDRADDAFATTLRLVGRCIANGAKVSDTIRHETAKRLVSEWQIATWRNRGKIGQLIIDGFSEPMFPELRAAIRRPFLMNNGGGEIVSRANDPELTIEVLESYLAQGLKSYTSFPPIQNALNAVGPRVFEIYAAMLQRPDITVDEIEGLANLISSLDGASLDANRILGLAQNESFPDSLRLACYSLTSPSLDASLTSIIHRSLRSESLGDRMEAERLLITIEDSRRVVFEILHDQSFDLLVRCELVERCFKSLPDAEARRQFVSECQAMTSLPERIRDIMSVFAASDGNEAIFVDLIGQLDSLDLHIAESTIALFGHYSSQALGIQAADAIRARVKTGSEAAFFSNGAVLGMVFKFEMYGLGTGGLAPARRHPAADVWADLLDEWSMLTDLTPGKLLQLLTAASSLGSSTAMDKLMAKVCEHDPDDTAFDVEDDSGSIFGSAVHQLLAARRKLPLEVCARLVRAKRPNVQYPAVSAIAAHASREALELLIALHNEVSTWHVVDALSDSIEILSGRLGVFVGKSGTSFTVR